MCKQLEFNHFESFHSAPTEQKSKASRRAAAGFAGAFGRRSAGAVGAEGGGPGGAHRGRARVRHGSPGCAGGMQKNKDANFCRLTNKGCPSNKKEQVALGNWLLHSPMTTGNQR